MHHTPETRVSLLVRLRDRADHDAWREFLEIYEPVIYRLARARGLQDADARDLTQQVLIAVADKVPKWQTENRQGSFRGWLFRVARNLIVNLIIHRQRHPIGSGSSRIQQLLDQHPAREGDDLSAFDFEYRRQLFHYAARQVRREFRSTTWSAFWQTCVEGRSVQQVAGELDLSAGAVYIARSRVMARLRRRIEQIEEST